MARILIGNIKGPKGDIGPQGIQGPTGPAGPQGPLPPLINNGLATQAGVAALDAAMGKTLTDQVAQLNSNFGDVNTKLVNGRVKFKWDSHISEERSDLEITIDNTVVANIPHNFNGFDVALTDDLAKAAYSTNLFAPCPQPTFLQWDNHTLNTPHTAGVTTSSMGFAIVYGDYGTNQVIFAMAMGSSTFFVHRCMNGTPSGWENK